MLVYCILILLTSLVAYINYFYYTYTFEFENGEIYNSPVHSPNNKYTAQAYFKTYGGAAGGVMMWIEVTHHDDHHRVETIYYSDAKSNFVMEWKDNDTLAIKNEDPEYPQENRNIELKVKKDIYDVMGGACNTPFVKNNYENCYHN
ncbi:MAG: DUF5412 family protein [Bacillus sp. (in: firmicutes)]